jgi:hypothetical protein
VPTEVARSAEALDDEEDDDEGTWTAHTPKGIARSRDDEEDDDEPGARVMFASVADYRDLEPDWYLGLRAWATKLRTRDDYAEFLKCKLGDHTIQEYLILAAWIGCDQPPTEDMPIESLDELGIEPDVGLGQLRRFLARGQLPYFKPHQIATARHELATKSEAKKTAPTVTEQAQEQAVAAAAEIDL